MSFDRRFPSSTSDDKPRSTGAAPTAQGTCLPHLAPLDYLATNPVSVAERLLGTPYLWGGNSSFGIDCSGLVQAALLACGLPCPGDSDQQETTLGTTLPANTPAQRGDLFFWKGHVAMAVDNKTTIHANAHHMAVSLECLQDLTASMRGDGPDLHKLPLTASSSLSKYSGCVRAGPSLHHADQFAFQNAQHGFQAVRVSDLSMPTLKTCPACFEAWGAFLAQRGFSAVRRKIEKIARSLRQDMP